MAEPFHHHRRPDFQGLRALAILVVIAYHFGLPGFGGGFVGVDVFFVLSGFFISQLLARDLAQHGRIRLGAFWLARAKRLLPNSLLALAATLVATAVLLPAYRFPAIAGDIGSAAVFLANVHFAAAAVDYFHIGSPPSPVLHFWSLAVEEQFYLALPLVWLAIARLRGSPRATLAIFAGLAALSLLAALVVITRNQPAAFFFPHYRAWELLMGCVVGLAYPARLHLAAPLRAALAWLGLALVVGSVVWLSDTTLYPGAWALAPVLGTAGLLVGLGSGRWTIPLERVLSLPPIVVIGNMSYSLYLWHWPVAVIMAAHFPTQPLAVAVGLALTGFLSALAYLLVERPIHRLPVGQLPSFAIPLASAAGLGAVLVASWALASLQSPRDPAVTAAIAAAQADKGAISANGCFLDYDAIAQPLCRAGDLSGTRRVVLFGDSHATQWYLPLSLAAKASGWVMELRNKSSCPFVDVTVWYVPLRTRYEPCDIWRENQLADLVANPPDLVVLASSAHYDTRLFDRTTASPAAPDQDQQLWSQGFSHAVQRLTQAGIAVAEVRDTPRLYANVLDCLSGGEWATCARPANEALAGLLSPPPDWPVLDFTAALCPHGLCSPTQDGQIIYRDSEHLTYSFPARFAPRFSRLLEDISAVAR